MPTPTKIYKDLDLTFSMTTSKDVAKRLDVNAVKQSIKNLLMTQRGERLFHPEIGADLYKILFEPMDFMTVETMKDIITTCLKNFEKRAVVQNVEIEPNYDTNEYSVTIYFYVIGIYTPASYNLTLKRVR